MNGSIDDIINGLESYKRSLKVKADALVKALADMGATNVSLIYARTPYTGPKITDVTVEERGEGKYAIVASGQTVLFLEFGAGVTYGEGHPNPMGYGPGTYPGKGHWNDPNGWYLPKSALGKSGIHTYGNAPSAAMYYTGKGLHQMVKQAAREVFGG